MKRAFAGEGIALRRDDDFCREGEIVSLSNLTFDIRATEERDALWDIEGDMTCALLAEDVFGKRIERFVWRNDDHPTYVRVLNVDCYISPVRIQHTDALERSLRHLPGVSPLPTTVPSGSAVHDSNDD